MTKSIRLFAALVAATLLGACGGGSSSGGFDSGGTGRITMTVEQDSVPLNSQKYLPNPDLPYTVQVNARLVQANGNIVPDGTNVTLSSSQPDIGFVSPIDDPLSTASQVTSPTASGFARFWFTSRDKSGIVSLAASAANPSGSGTISAAIEVEVLPQDTGPRRVVVESNESQVPVNLVNAEPELGSAFSTQINVIVRSRTGGPAADGTQVSLGVSNTGRATVASLDELEESSGSAVSEVTAGSARFLLTSGRNTGPVQLTATVSEEGTTVQSAPLTVQIVPSDTPEDRLVIELVRTELPANKPGFAPAIGSPFSAQINVIARRADGSPVPDGEEVSLGVNNTARAVLSALNELGESGGNATAEVQAGAARFLVTSGQETGSVRFDASFTDADDNVLQSQPAFMTIIDSQTDTDRVLVSPAASEIAANPRGLEPNLNFAFTTIVNVQVFTASGLPVSDGTSVTLGVDNPALARLSTLANPSVVAAGATAQTSGGQARFLLTATGPNSGAVELVGSIAGPQGNVLLSAPVTVSVLPSEDESDRIDIEPVLTELPANTIGLQPALNSPFTTQVNVSVEGDDGNPSVDGTTVRLGVDNVNRGQLSALGSTAVAGEQQVTTQGGIARFWLTSGAETGPLNLVASVQTPSGFLTSSMVTVQITDTEQIPDRISVQPLSIELPANILDLAPSINSQFSTQVNVQVLNPSGQPAADGTSVSLVVDNAARGTVSSLADPENSGGGAVATTQAGQAQFLLTSGREEGPVNLVASVANQQGGAILSAPRLVTILPNTEDDARLTISGKATIPANKANVPIFFGSPFINELTVEYLGPDGQPGSVQGGTVAVAIAPVTLAAFSTLNDPTTAENEFEQLVGAGPVINTAGVTSLFVHSFEQPGPVTLTVVAQDAFTGEIFSAKFDIEIIDGAADGLPAQQFFDVSPDPVYIQGSGGSTVKSIDLLVLDSGDNVVPDPEADGVGFNNVRLELIKPEGSGARLTGTGAAGSVNGTEIDVQTVNGIANFALNAGTEIGPHRIIATVDRADNNVDNGLQDPVSAEITIEVGDGQLFALRLVNPIVNAILINRVLPEVETDQEPTLDPDTGVLIPPDPDGTYSLTITAQGSDRAGNPVLPGTVVNFGKVDAPLTQTNPPLFYFSGPFGDPEEAGFLFSVEVFPEGFLHDPLILDEAVEPGDFLALFGKSVPGNREHEAVRVVDEVIDQNTLTVTERFNPNDGTGTPVDDGAVIPWVIGRSQVGVVDQTVILGEQGRGSVQLTYPVNAIGRPLVLWTQGTRPQDGDIRTIADVETLLFPGVAPLVLTATPNQVSGNQTVNITLCLRDGIGSPVPGVFINATVGGGTGTVSVDGNQLGDGLTPDRVGNATGENGCVVTQMTTLGMVPDEDDLLVVFFVGQARDTVTVKPPGSATLSVQPSRFVDQFNSAVFVDVILTLREASGNPISGVPLSGVCQDPPGGNLDIIDGPGITGPDGRTTARLFIRLSSCDPAQAVTGEFTCSFTTPSGTPTGIFTAVGGDLSIGGDITPSPPCPAP